MKILACLALIALANAGDVLQFTDADFESQMGEHDLVLMKFYAPWCGHCKRLAPEYERAATILKDNDPPVALAEIDCTSESKSCGKHGVSGYPTLKIFRGGDAGNAEEYSGPREADGIVKFMRGKAGPTSKHIESVEDLEKFLAKPEHSIVGFFESDSSKLLAQYKKLADALSEDHRFAFTTDAAVREKSGHSEAVVIFQPDTLKNKFDESELKYDGEAQLAPMKEWLNDNIHGFAGHRTSGNQNQFKRPLFVVYYDVDYVKNVKGTNYWRNRVMKVAKGIKEAGKMAYFAVSNKDEFNHELTEYGVEVRGDKPVVAARDASEQKFVMDVEFSVAALEQFVNDVLEDKVEPYLKSEPIPASQEDVKVVVAKNFNEIVNDDSKDVLIEFYAPWCGHCKQLTPKYEELAQKLADEEEIVIAKMDATANDVPKPYEVRGFPTIFFAPAGSKGNPRKYEGGREVKDFLKYLAKESTNPLQGYTRDGKKKKETDKTEL